jgi:hypothetical protein
VGSRSSPLACVVFLPPPLLQSFPFLNAGLCCCSFWLACLLQLTWEVVPPLLWRFPPSTTLTRFPAPGCWARAPAPAGASLARPNYLHFQEGFPSPPLWSSGHPTLFAMCLYCSYCLLLSFSFFPRWGSVCLGGYADLAQGCLWKYHVLLSSAGPRLPRPSG